MIAFYTSICFRRIVILCKSEKEITEKTFVFADEMYVLSASNKRVSVQLLGKDKIEDKLSRFEELKSASVSYLGVSSLGGPAELLAAVPSELVFPFCV